PSALCSIAPLSAPSAKRRWRRSMMPPAPVAAPLLAPPRSEREKHREPVSQPRNVRGARVGAQPVERTLVEAAAAVDDDAGQRQGGEVQHRIGQLLVGGAGDALVFRLYRQAVSVAGVAEEDVDLAVLSVDGLAHREAPPVV